MGGVRATASASENIDRGHLTGGPGPRTPIYRDTFYYSYMATILLLLRLHIKWPTSSCPLTPNTALLHHLPHMPKRAQKDQQPPPSRKTE